MNIGYCVRGMDFAIESGRLAAETILKARESDDYSAKTLSAYLELLNDSFVMRDLKFIEISRLSWRKHAVCSRNILRFWKRSCLGWFCIDGSEPKKLSKKALTAEHAI